MKRRIDGSDLTTGKKPENARVWSHVCENINSVVKFRINNKCSYDAKMSLLCIAISVA